MHTLQLQESLFERKHQELRSISSNLKTSNKYIDSTIIQGLAIKDEGERIK